jgi:hypothetical protein
VDLDGGSSLESAVGDWLSARARDRGVVGRESSRLSRIVFEEGEVTGAVLATPDGPWTLRARVGVAVAPEHPAGAPRSTTGVTGTMQVCLVGRTASRFGRVELIAAEPIPAISRSVCDGLDRPSPEGRRESRSARSPSRR